MTKKNKNPALNFLIVKDVPVSILEAVILNSLKDSYKYVDSVVRFYRNGKALPVIKIGFKNLDEFNQCLVNGFDVNNIYFKPEKFCFIQKPTQCFKCWKFGHISTSCSPNSPSSCSKCSSTDHKFTDCNSTSFLCINCKGNHCANDKSCPIFLKKVEQLNRLC